MNKNIKCEPLKKFFIKSGCAQDYKEFIKVIDILKNYHSFKRYNVFFFINIVPYIDIDSQGNFIFINGKKFN